MGNGEGGSGGVKNAVLKYRNAPSRPKAQPQPPPSRMTSSARPQARTTRVLSGDTRLRPFWGRRGNTGGASGHLYWRVRCRDWEHFLTAAGLRPPPGSERMGRDANGKYDMKGLENEGESITDGNEHP